MSNEWFDMTCLHVTAPRVFRLRSLLPCTSSLPHSQGVNQRCVRFGIAAGPFPPSLLPLLTPLVDLSETPLKSE